MAGRGTGTLHEVGMSSQVIRRLQDPSAGRKLSRNSTSVSLKLCMPQRNQGPQSVSEILYSMRHLSLKLTYPAVPEQVPESSQLWGRPPGSITMWQMTTS